jgi:polygalacturonase
LKWLLSICLIFCCALPSYAQDTRTVTEPKIPAACTVLNAQLTAAGGKTLAEADETKFDTARIQDALDHCRAGQAVKLVSNGASNAFLAGPLQLRNGVTLVVDAGAILFASRNPRDYDISPGSCGVVNANGKGCRPLIGGDGIQNAGVMGDGAIDGRGGAHWMVTTKRIGSA